MRRIRKEEVRKIPITLLSISLVILISLPGLLFTSCAKSLTDEGFSDAYTPLREEWYYIPSIEIYPWESSKLDLVNEDRRLDRLHNMIAANPEKKSKYENEIKEICEQASKDRLKFLQTFYADLYQTNQKKFTRQYKYRCAEDVKKLMKDVYGQLHKGEKGYAWFVFGDNARHKGTDFSFNCIESNWYEVKMDTNKVFVRLSGKSKDVTITGIYNPQFKLGLR